MAAKQLLFEENARRALERGVNKVADAVNEAEPGSMSILSSSALPHPERARRQANNSDKVARTIVDRTEVMSALSFFCMLLHGARH